MAGYSVENFITDMEALVASEPRASLLDQGASLLERLVVTPNVLPERYRVPAEKTGRPNHGTYLLHASPDGLSVTAVVWGPGDGLGPHDHHTWGLIGVVANEITETRFRRLDDGSDPDRARIERDRESIATPGQVSMLVPDVDEIHQMYNATRVPTVEIHVYGTELKGLERCLFDVESGRITRFASKAYDND
jgi:predicted metal-dependent enzyme (double-stranded beta helix superfamily)